MKKATKMLLRLMLAAAMCFPLVACGIVGGDDPAGGDDPTDVEEPTGGETFLGAVSEATYESVEDAIKGFLEVEVSGISATAEFVAYTKVETLSETQIQSFELGEYSEGLVSVEKGTVEYLETAVSDMPAPLSANNASREKTVYILTYSVNFRFFVSAATLGETLTASEYTSLLQIDKYLNCTIDAVAGIPVVVDGEVVLYDIPSKFMITEEGIYMYTESLYSVNGEAPSINPIYMYFIEVDGGLRSEGEHSGYVQESSYKDFVTTSTVFYGILDNIDHTYFKKTETGYTMRADKYAEFIQDNYGRELEDDDECVFDIVIQDGRPMDITVIEVQGGITSVALTFKFYDFGTTVIPDEVKAMFSE